MTTLRNPIHPVLIVDDEVHILKSFEITLKAAGITNIICCQDSGGVMDIIAENPIYLVLLDLSMPHLDGEQTFRELRRIRRVGHFSVRGRVRHSIGGRR